MVLGGGSRDYPLALCAPSVDETSRGRERGHGTQSGLECGRRRSARRFAPARRSEGLAIDALVLAASAGVPYTSASFPVPG